MYLHHISKVMKVGSSLMVTIPAQLARDLRITRGDQVIVAAQGAAQFSVRVLTDKEIELLSPLVIE